MAEIVAVCKSEEKGTRKEAVVKGILRQDYGLDGDAHADRCTHRQVSLLAMESIKGVSQQVCYLSADRQVHHA